MADTISTQLRHYGLPDDWPVLLVERGTHADQRALRTTLATMSTTIVQHALKSPTLILVGKVIEHYRPEQDLALAAKMFALQRTESR